MSLLVRRGLLPEDAEARRVALRAYFCDKDATSKDAGANWALTLDWPDDPSRYVDPDLADGLAWWGIDILGVPLAWRREGRTTFSLFDSWGLHSWSRWWAAGGRAAAEAAGGVLVLHVDDHADLMSPRLLQAGTGLSDAVTGKAFDLGAPSTVAAAISSGAVGMGSFVTPFLFGGVPVHLRHLRQRSPSIRGRLTAGWEPDTLLAPGLMRPSVVPAPGKDQGTGGADVLVTGDEGEWLAGLPEWPALLHIDLDYFSNRFDGDSDWADVAERLDPPLDAILEAMERMFGSLAASAVRHRIQDVAVAYSPGFFPAEFWSSIDGALRRGLASIGAL